MQHLLNNIVLCLGDDALLFPGDNIEQYGISRGLSDPLSAISACFWINTPASYQDTNAPTQISYATPTQDNEFVIWIHKHILAVVRSGTGFTYVVQLYYSLITLSL